MSHDPSEMIAWKDAHKDERCFIVLTGPSLDEMDLNPLAKENVIGVNMGYFIPQFKTDYLVLIDSLVILQFREEFEAVDSQVFTTKRELEGDQVWNLDWINPNEANLWEAEFQDDLTKPIWQGFGVSWVAMQLAYYMGFDPVILIGADHSWRLSGYSHEWGNVNVVNDDLDHAEIANYPEGTKLGLRPEFRTFIEIGYWIAGEHYWKNGRRIYNASTFSKIPWQAIPRIRWDWIKYGML